MPAHRPDTVSRLPGSAAPSALSRHGAGVWLIGTLCTALLAAPAGAATPADLLAGYTAQAGAPASPARGQQFFNTKQGREWACASCHGAVPTQDGKHAATGKRIGPLAPAFNAERFTNEAKSDKWFRRNCGDVVGRDCTPGEKADVLSWLMTQKP